MDNLHSALIAQSTSISTFVSILKAFLTEEIKLFTNLDTTEELVPSLHSCRESLCLEHPHFMKLLADIKGTIITSLKKNNPEQLKDIATLETKLNFLLAGVPRSTFWYTCGLISLPILFCAGLWYYSKINPDGLFGRVISLSNSR